MQACKKIALHLSKFHLSKHLVHKHFTYPAIAYFSTQTTQPKRRVLVVGTSLEGLTTALALRQKGVYVDVVGENAEAEEEIPLRGSGILITPNVSRIFDKMGILKHVVRAGQVTKYCQVVTNYGKHLFDHNWSVMSAYPFVAIRKLDLHKILLNELNSIGNGRVLFKEKLSEIAQKEEHVDCKFRKSFATARYAVLVGADGVHSKIRDEFFDKDPGWSLNFSQILYNSVIIKCPSELDYQNHLFEWWGEMRRLVAYAVNKEDLCIESYVYSQTEQALDNKGRAVVRSMRAFHKYTTGYGAEILMEYLNAFVDAGAPSAKSTVHAISKNIFTHSMKNIVNRNMALVGDAAHCPNPSFFHEATVKVEDAYVLAHYLSQTNLPIQEALQKYNSISVGRANKVHSRGAAYAKQYKKRLNKLTALTYKMKLRFGYSQYLKMNMQQLIKKDVTSLS